MGYKNFVAGEEALAADVNAYLMAQTVARFASAAARTSALTAPAVNQLTMRDDLPGQLEYWNGSAWSVFPRKVGFGAYNAAQSVGPGATVPLVFSAEEFDTDTIGAAGSSAMTIPVTGIYSLQAFAEAPPAATAPSRIEWIVGGARAAGATFPPGGGGSPAVTLTSVLPLIGGTATSIQIINGNTGAISYSVTVRLLRLGPW